MTPAEELQQAAMSISVRADCAPGSFWSAVADWLDSAAGVAWRTQDEGAVVSPASHALKVARAYRDRVTKEDK